MDFELDLDKCIESLKNRWKELKAISADPPGPSAAEMAQQMGEIALQMKEIEERILTLENIRANENAATVVIPEPSGEEVAALNTALDNLSKVIQREQVFDNILAAVTTALNGADSVILAAGTHGAGGHPTM